MEIASSGARACLLLLRAKNKLDPVLHSEVPRSCVAQVQLRPDPLAH